MSKKYIDNKCVVKFQNENRKITMYFEQDSNGELMMSMDMNPEFDPEKDEEPDLCMLLCSSLINVLNPEVETKEDDKNPKVYDGTD